MEIKKEKNAEIDIPKLMHRLQMSYSKYFNHKYAHSGAVFQGAYKAKPVETEAYLITLMNYIHSNPVKDKLTEKPEDWAFSSFLNWKNITSKTVIDKNEFPLSGSYLPFYKECLELLPTPSVDTRC